MVFNLIPHIRFFYFCFFNRNNTNFDLVFFLLIFYFFDFVFLSKFLWILILSFKSSLFFLFQ